MKIKFQDIKDAIVFITPSFANSETVRYKLRFTKIIQIVLEKQNYTKNYRQIILIA